jgi:hypothetical protein
MLLGAPSVRNPDEVLVGGKQYEKAWPYYHALVLPAAELEAGDGFGAGQRQRVALRQVPILLAQKSDAAVYISRHRNWCQ